jgi:transposase
VKGRSYLLLVENHRVDGKVKQNTKLNLGPIDKVIESGVMNQILLSGEKFADKILCLAESKSDQIEPLYHYLIGPSLVFGKIWKVLQIDKIITQAINDRNFEFSVERTIFASVMHRLIDTGSDRSCINWLDTAHVFGLEGIKLQHCYRSMNWLGEPLDKANIDDGLELGQESVDGFNEPPTGQFNNADRKPGKEPKVAKSVRCVKDVLEERIYSARSNLLTSLDLVFFDTTSFSFQGAGGDELGARGHSKDHRPDLNQVVFGLVIDNRGYPVCSEVWPGNTADVTTLMAVAQRLKRRFDIKKVCIVADRGMISKNTITQILEQGWSYILGVKMRQSVEARAVLEDDGEYILVREERKRSIDPAPLQVKEVFINGTRYIACLNGEEARKDERSRQGIIKSLKKTLKTGDKSIIENKGYKKYINTIGHNFYIDMNKVNKDKKYDVVFILTTNLDKKVSEIALQYKQLLSVETMFRNSKSLFHTKPIYHHRDENIRGHIWITFLSLILKKYLQDALEKDREKNENPLEWNHIIEDLKTLTYSIVESNGKKFAMRSVANPGIVRIFRALGINLPQKIKLIDQLEDLKL